MSEGLKSVKNRKSNIELLRIIAILFVILSHFNVHSGFREVLSSEFNINVLLSLVFSVGCIANCVFILITGYFLSDKKIKYSKILSLIIEMYFYSIGIYLLFGLIMPDKSRITDIKTVLLPFPYGNWFCVCYIILFMLSPVINNIFRKINEDKRLLLIIFMLTASFVIGNICPIVTLNNMMAFVTIYLVGAYIKSRHLSFSAAQRKKYLLFVIAIWTVVASLSYILTCALGDSRYVWWGIKLTGKNTSILVILFGFILFMYYKELDMKYNKWVNTIAASTLGVYLIHENPVIRNLIWKDFLPVNIYSINPALFVMVCVLKVVIVFCSCTLIDYARIKLFGLIRRKNDSQKQK